MNCISWNVGHLTWQEQRYWLGYGGGRMLRTDIDEAFRYGAPASTPRLADMWKAWDEITRESAPWLNAVTNETLETHVERDGKPTEYIFGSLLLRTIYHYWYHIGENAAIRQALGHTGLPDFVGDIDTEAPYRRG